MDKIIFLDIDGVLSNDNSEFDYFDKPCVEALNKIIEGTGAKIVLSSSWRTGDLNLTKAIFDSGGFYITNKESLAELSQELTDQRNKAQALPIVESKHLIAETPRIRKQRTEAESWGRGHEIDSWLNANKSKVSSYLVLDDETHDLTTHTHRHVVTDSRIGLLEEHIERCIAILNTEMSN